MKNSLYIHLPFCQRKCLFCSFAIAVAQNHRVEEYVNALGCEARLYQGKELGTIYFGGGTPSVLEIKDCQRVLEIIRDHFSFNSSIEQTIEVNPENVTLEYAEGLFACGFNRVSLGVQTLNDVYLKFLGRVHTAQKARDAFDVLRKVGFRNINIDMMMSFPGQQSEEILQDVKDLSSWGSEHMSVYALTVEERSRFYAAQVQLNSSELRAEQYTVVRDALIDEGFEQYEVSNFARSGFESQHNLQYWTGGNYLGLGMGAHSHQDGRRWWNVERLMPYIQSLQKNQRPVESCEELTAQQRLSELLAIGLRMNQGVDVKVLERAVDCPLSTEQLKMIDTLIEEGMLLREDGMLKSTKRGQLVLDEIAVKLI